MSSKQLVFPRPMTCTHIYPDGREERVRYGYFEAIKIVSENGWPVNRMETLIPPRYCLEEVVKTDGTKVVFDEPICLLNEREYGDGSGRMAKRWDARHEKSQ